MKRWLALDLRALGALRIAYGLLLLLDVLIRTMDLHAHYTDLGVAPRLAVLELSGYPEFFSYHFANGTWLFQAVLMAWGGFLALCLAAGYRTRLVTVLSWIHLCSLHTRNPMILDAGDSYFRCMLFWCIFLPWGARYSVDAARHKLAGEDHAWLDWSTVAYILQICLLYQVSVFHKTGPVWRHDFTAVYWALMIDQLSTPFAPMLLARPYLMKALTVLVLGFEAVGPFLLWMGRPLRWLGAIGISLMHIGFGSFLHLGVFALIGIFTPIGLWPGHVFERLEQPFRKLAQRWPLPGGEDPTPRPWNAWVAGLLVFLMTYVVAWNVNNLRPFGLPGVIGRTLRLDQQWNMFAPVPLVEDGWYVIDAEKMDGSHIDLCRGGAPVDWSKPHHIAGMYPNARWRKFMMNLWSSDLAAWRLHYGRYLTRQWNNSHSGSEQIRTFHIYFMLEKTLPDGRTSPVEKIDLWNHHCF